jgi:predicted alpha/beta-hydrolase family hydrolase
MEVDRLMFEATPRKGEVTGLWLAPEAASHALILSHAASTNMEHASMVVIAEALHDVGIATFRYNFPYMEKGSGGLDGKSTCYETVRSAVSRAKALANGIPLLAGGRSFGGRMTSMAVAESAIDGLVGIVFYAFPLHPAKKPSIDRANHLESVGLPVLFLSGTRDALAEQDLLKLVVDGLENATLHTIETADHSFKVLKQSGLTEALAQEQAAAAVKSWLNTI